MCKIVFKLEDLGLLGLSKAPVTIACDGFASGLRRISRHFRPGSQRDSLRLPGNFWASGGHRVTFNSGIKPGAALRIAN